MKSFFLLGLLLPSTAFACLQGESGTSINGYKKLVGNNMAVRSLRQAMRTNPGDTTAEARFGEGETEFQKQEQEALNKIFSGDYNAAIELLKAQESKSPGHYTTAANLGTAYELIGDNVNALKWITEGMKLNPESHQGTEWLHALILETKIAEANHSNCPLASRILNVPEQMKADTKIQVHDKEYSAYAVRNALLLQLNERLIFVKPKNPYVADLLYSYALIEANLNSVESGISLLKMAREYGFSDEALLNLRQEQYESLVRTAQLRWWGMTVFVIGGLILFLYYSYRRKWFFLTKRAYKAHKEALTMAKGS